MLIGVSPAFAPGAEGSAGRGRHVADFVRPFLLPEARTLLAVSARALCNPRGYGRGMQTGYGRVCRPPSASGDAVHPCVDRRAFAAEPRADSERRSPETALSTAFQVRTNSKGGSAGEAVTWLRSR